jgi:hypothetical protein
MLAQALTMSSVMYSQADASFIAKIKGLTRNKLDRRWEVLIVLLLVLITTLHLLPNLNISPGSFEIKSIRIVVFLSILVG